MTTKNVSTQNTEDAELQAMLANAGLLEDTDTETVERTATPPSGSDAELLDPADLLDAEIEQALAAEEATPAAATLKPSAEWDAIVRGEKKPEDAPLSPEDALLAEIEAAISKSEQAPSPAAAEPQDKPALTSPGKKRDRKKAEKPTPAPAEAAPTEAQGEAPAEGEVAPAEQPKEPKHRVTYYTAKRSEVLAHRLDGKVSDYLILEHADAALDDEQRAALQAQLMDDINNKLAKKVAEKVVMLFKWLKNGGELNYVMATAFTILARDGRLTAGKNGNLHLALRERLSELTANSQGNQMFQMMPFLKITTRDGAHMKANKNSVILEAAAGLLKLEAINFAE